MAAPKLNKIFPPSEPCSCDICISYCARPGWWTIDEAIKIIESDYANRCMLEVSPEFTFGVISPAFRGAECNFGLQEYSENKCTFLKDELCELFETGFQPIECRYCHHSRVGLGEKCHYALEMEWNTFRGQKTVEKWIEKVGFKWKDYFHNLISGKK